jgi:hypothetical protein
MKNISLTWFELIQKNICASTITNQHQIKFCAGPSIVGKAGLKWLVANKHSKDAASSEHYGMQESFNHHLEKV